MRKKEQAAYVIWGVVSSILNIGIFQFLIFIGIDYKVSNIIALFFIRIFCYITNKFFVFHTKCRDWKELLREFFVFFCVRIFTFFVDFCSVLFLAEVIQLHLFVSKIISSFVVVSMNYFFSRLFVFKSDRTTGFRGDNQ